MAVSAVSSVGGGYLQLFRARQVEGIAEDRAPSGLPRVQAAPELAGREDAEGAAHAAPEGKAGARDQARPLPVDPRRPESILAGRKDDRDIRSRLDDLLGQKSALERRQAEQNGQRSAEIMEVIAQLRSRDGAVRAHEAAHMAAGGRYITGGASYSYERGPDGVEYAVGGEVGVDTSPVPGKPEETAQKMRIIRAAALAPSDPSAADISIAAAASQMEAEALAEIAQAGGGEAAARVDAASRYSKAAEGPSGEPRPNSLDMVA
jgi:hypothetical protein